MCRIVKPIISWNEQVNIARKHAAAYYAAREALNSAINDIKNDLEIVNFDEQLAKDLHGLYDNTQHMPGDIDGVISDAGINDLYTVDESDHIATELINEQKYKEDRKKDYYGAIL